MNIDAAAVDHKLIVCIVPKGAAMPALESLKAERGILTANITNARGAGRLTPLAYRGVGETTEKEILKVAVPARQAEEIFAFLYERAQINRPHGGLVFMHGLGRMTAFTLPEVEEEH